MPQYKVMVDDNFHYQDSEERREHGTYATVDEALAVCRGLVDHYLNEQFRSGISADELYDRYTSFGDDPFIIVLGGTDSNAIFSAWDYAREQCRALCDFGRPDPGPLGHTPEKG